MVSAKDDQLQEWAANCIQNVRRLALANERAKRKAPGAGAGGQSSGDLPTNR